MRLRDFQGFSIRFVQIAVLLLAAPGCGLFSSSSTLTALPRLTAAVGSSTTTTTSAREDWGCPNCAVTSSSAGGLLLHSSAKANNNTELSTNTPRVEYDLTLKFLELATYADQYVCAVSALKTAGLLNFNGSYAYIRDPSSNPIRVRVNASGDNIQSWEVASCTGTTHDRLVTGEANSTTATIMLKYKTATRTARVDATGLITSSGSWSSKILDFSERDTGTSRGYRVNLTQSRATIQITGTEVNTTGPAILYAFAAKAKLYGTAYTNTGSTAYGLGAGSSRKTTDGSTYSTSHWTDAAASAATSDYVNDVADQTTYPASAYTTSIANAALTTSETWDCVLGSTFIDLTSPSVMTGTLATSINACLTAP
jgi:hypothetical protein